MNTKLTILLSFIIFAACQYLLIELLFSFSQSPLTLIGSYIIVTWFTVFYLYFNCKVAGMKHADSKLRTWHSKDFHSKSDESEDSPSVEENSEELARKFGPLGEIKTQPKDFS